MEGCRVFGVRHPGAGADDAAQTAYLDRPVEATPDVLAMAGEVAPTEVFRLAATCEEAQCVHFDGADCRLATRIVALLPPVVGVVPRCAIRADCRWHRQEGKAYDAGDWATPEAVAATILHVLDLPRDVTITDVTVRPGPH